MSLRAYAVLVEVSGDSHYGDVLFCWLGVFDARTPEQARRQARAAHNIGPEVELVAVPATAWRAERAR